MKNRIRIIFLLITTSLVVLLIIQGFWINKFYKINKQQISKEIKLSLESSVKKEMRIRYVDDAKTIFSTNNINSFAVVKDTLSNPKLDSIFKVFNDEKVLNPSEISVSFTSFSDSMLIMDSGLIMNSVPDKIEFRLKELVGTLLANQKQNQKTIDLFMIDSLLQDEFAQRGITVDYYLEIYDRISNSAIQKLRVEFFDETNDMKFKMPATILGDKEIRLITKDNAKSFFGQPVIKGSLLATLGLLVLVVSSFFYMLKTIFDQKKLSAIKNDFINNMTHELKTPIATVSAIVESMQNFGVLDDIARTNKYLDVSQKELGRLSGLVEKVLNMAREEREPLKISPEELNIREVCDNIINSQSIKQCDKQVSFDMKIDEEAEKVCADRFHIVNVMQNLIENSIKYSGDPVMIRIACDRYADFIKISVSDNGIGISKKHQAKVFDQFYRVPTGDVHDVKGFGLGLYYVRNIVEKHGGRIGLNSEPGKGSTFIINLPVY
ncbi:sensor histidine kinase [Marinifilum sp.]|uniref:sensor histidine kinase n=1 Tax=Marinifilum sp. TaxID=2033137 RepID=UPI003BAA6999